MKRTRLWITLFSVQFFFSIAGSARNLPTAAPETVGLSPERLGRLGAVMQQYVDEGRVAGVVMLVARNGQVAYHESFGRLSLEHPGPMPKAAIFRIASQSKAITSVAVMMLMEEGRLLLNDPISKHIPEFRETLVAVPTEGGGGDQKAYTTQPARRPITVHDLLTHTAGISYGSGPAEPLYREADVFGWYFADQDRPIGEAINRLAGLPFDAQPGEKWVYGFNTDILGYLVERISGLSLAEFFEQRIFQPLQMVDSSFYLPEEKVSRFTPVYGVREEGGLELIEDAAGSHYVKGPRKSYSGGAGLLCTAMDYARFLQMLLNGGELEGTRLLGPKTVRLMTVNHVGDLYGDRGFGLGFWILEDLGKYGQPGSPDSFGWGGAYYTTFWVDPVEQLVAVFMTQLLPARGLDLQGKFNALVYQSITESYAR